MAMRRDEENPQKRKLSCKISELFQNYLRCVLDVSATADGAIQYRSKECSF
jgi:hypothetical protein